MSKQTGKVYFKIDFDWLTNYVRDLWSEGEYALARQLFRDCQIPDDIAARVIAGSKKMAQDPDGIPGSGGMITGDSWQPNLSHCFLGKYPDWDNAKHFRMIDKYGVKYLGRMWNEIGMLSRMLAESNNYFEKVRLSQEINSVPGEVIDFLGYKRPETIHTDDRDYMPEIIANPDELSRPVSTTYEDKLLQLQKDHVDSYIKKPFAPNVPDVDTYVRRQIELDKMDFPEPTYKTKTGYLSPDGKLYPCGWMEHEWIASKLGISSLGMEMAGWIRITHQMGDPEALEVLKGDKEPTQKQIDTIYDWAKFNKLDPVKFIKELINE